ncbi:histidinol-phosphatase [Marinifilum sp.]|uniref:histidinol-phosphatase n=1 Tax=Marinifilum sp. TaxID=2033137 RepID=UPI003BAA0E4B
MTYFSYHTHSSYCDGKENPEDYIKQGILQGLRAIGFSSHAPIPVATAWAMKTSNIDSYIQEINQLKEKYKNEIEVYLSLELDYIPGVSKSFSEWKKNYGLDYTIGSVHLVKAESEEELWFLDGPDTNYTIGLQKLFKGDIKKAVTAYFKQVIEMIETQSPDVVGHVDKVKMNNKGRYFSETDEWYIHLLDKSLDVIEKAGSIVEVNTRGIYKKKSDKLFPDDYFLKQCHKRNIDVTISSDAHHPKELLCYFEETRNYLKLIGFESVTVFHKGEWIIENI